VNLTAFGQSHSDSSNCKGVCYTVEMDIKAIQTYRENERRKEIIKQKDSIIASQQMLMNYKDSTNLSLKNIVEILEVDNDRKAQKIALIEPKLIRAKRQRNHWLVIGSLGGMISGYFIFKN